MLCQRYTEQAGYANPAAVVDCNHANSGKRSLEQYRIAKEVLHSKRHSNDINALVKGMMIESYIEDGNQKVAGAPTARASPTPASAGKRAKTRAGAG